MTRSSQGQVLVFFAIVLPLVLLPLAAYAIDAAASASAYARLDEVTVRAAEEAAQQIDAGRLRSGAGFQINVADAAAAAQNVMAESLPAATVVAVTVDRLRVTVKSRIAVTLPLQLIGPSTLTLQVTVSARLALGYDRSSSLLPLSTSTF